MIGLVGVGRFIGGRGNTSRGSPGWMRWSGKGCRDFHRWCPAIAHRIDVRSARQLNADPQSAWDPAKGVIVAVVAAACRRTKGPRQTKDGRTQSIRRTTVEAREDSRAGVCRSAPGLLRATPGAPQTRLEGQHPRRQGAQPPGTARTRSIREGSNRRRSDDRRLDCRCWRDPCLRRAHCRKRRFARRQASNSRQMRRRSIAARTGRQRLTPVANRCVASPQSNSFCVVFRKCPEPPHSYRLRTPPSLLHSNYEATRKPES